MESNNLERRVRALEQDLAAHKAWGLERANRTDENFRRAEGLQAELKKAFGELTSTVTRLTDTVAHASEETTDRVGKLQGRVAVMLVVMTALLSLLYYAIR